MNASSGLGAYQIMAHRIANRVAEMAENYTFVEKPQQGQSRQQEEPQQRRKPRKLEMRLQTSRADAVQFSAPFLDNTLNKMLALQNQMLQTGSTLATNPDVSEKVKKEQFAQSAELSRIIALICAEKARQEGAEPQTNGA